MSRPIRRRIVPLVAASAVAMLAARPAPAGAASIVINNVDPPGVGFNDPTPVLPVGGNPGLTLGQQRLNVFELAADVWGAVLESDVEIVVQATFRPLPCRPEVGVLGGAAPMQGFSFNAPAPPGAYPGFWYTGALANSLAGVDLAPGPPDPGLLAPPFADDIVALFNGSVGTDPDCLGGLEWYNGLDHGGDPGAQIDLLNTVVHELGHGLGFISLVNPFDAGLLLGIPDIYSAFTFDTTRLRFWTQMTQPERAASRLNTGNLVWAGPAVNQAAPDHLGPRPSLVVAWPLSLLGSVQAQPADFGPPLTEGLDSFGLVVVVEDEDGDADACEPIVSDVIDAVALIGRGECTFTTKVRNAQDAGARAVVVVNDQPGGLPPMGGADPAVVIPSVGISSAAGLQIAAAAVVQPVVAGPILDARFLAGAKRVSGVDLVRLYAPDPLELGSSASHFDTTASPNLLMEPILTPDIRAVEELDLTPLLLRDIGWRLAE